MSTHEEQWTTPDKRERNEKRQRCLELPKLIAAEPSETKRKMLRRELDTLRELFPPMGTASVQSTHDAVIEALKGAAMPEKLTPSQTGLLPAQPRTAPWAVSLDAEQRDRLLFCLDARGAGINGDLELKVALPLHQWYALVGSPRKTGDEYIKATFIDGEVLGEIVRGLQRALAIAEYQLGRSYDPETRRADNREWKAVPPRVPVQVV